VFMWHTGEEAGLYGSRYNADFPVVPLEKVIEVVGSNVQVDLNETDVAPRSNEVRDDDQRGRGGPVLRFFSTHRRSIPRRRLVG